MSSSQRPDTAAPHTERTARYWVRANGLEIPLTDRQTLIGRSDDCQIRVKDSLVSRRHARLFQESGDIWLQDLGSANGVFVNQRRVEDRTKLQAGDQIFVGTCEIVLFENTTKSDRVTERDMFAEQPERETPISYINPAAVVYPCGILREEPMPERDLPDSEQSTAHSAGLDYLGRLADKMFAMGRVDAAKRILSSHLEEMLAAVKRGRTVEPKIIDLAARYSIRLAGETLEAHWVDLAVDLHISAKHTMLADNVQRLAALRAKAPIGSADLLQRYSEQLRSMRENLSPAERIIAERIACLGPDSES